MLFRSSVPDSAIEYSGGTSVGEDNNATPNQFTLYQNYPNPFNPKTVIRCLLPSNSVVTLKVYNILGNEVETLLNNKEMQAGEHSVSFDATNLSSGMYFYRIQAKDFSETKKLVLIK